MQEAGKKKTTIIFKNLLHFFGVRGIVILYSGNVTGTVLKRSFHAFAFELFHHRFRFLYRKPETIPISFPMLFGEEVFPITIKDIAREAGCSVSTVSRVISGHPDVSPVTRERVQALIRLHNFSPNNNAQRLKQQESRTVGIIVKGTSNALFASLIEHLQTHIEQASCTAAVVYLDEEGDELQAALQFCRETHPCGLFFLGSNRSAFLQNFSEITVPSVLLTASAKGMNFPNLSSVCIDDAAGAEAAMEFLLERGHRKIAVIGGSLSSSDASRVRFAGFCRCFERHGLSFERDGRYETARFSLSSSYRAMGRLLDSFPEVTGVLCMSDLMAIGVLRAICDRGLRAPDDISVIGFDGIELSRYCVPKLTTVLQDTEKIASRGISLLLEAMSGRERAVYETVPYAIVEGESVKQLTALPSPDAH